MGITMNLENQEWNTFLNTRKNGDYSVARNGWLADYNDPICFLDMWITDSGNNDVQFGRDAHADVPIYSMDLTSLGYDVKVDNGTVTYTYTLKVDYPDEFVVAGQIGTYYVCWNINEQLLP